MKYYRWKLKWENEEGTDFTSIVNNDATRIEPDFETNELKNPESWIYGYLLSGNIDVADLKDWHVEEVSPIDILNAAKILNSEAFIDVSGKIVFPFDE